MSRLGDKRRAYKREQAKQEKQENKVKNGENRAIARQLVKELGPQHFVDIKEIEERLVTEGHFTIPEKYFHIRDMDYLHRVHGVHKKYKAMRDMLKDKVNFLSMDILLEPEYFLAKDEFIADEVARYLSRHDIALLDTGLSGKSQYKLFIIE